jgi:hypothetical protein
MSRRQWGHGYHTGKREVPQKGYVGLFFHSFHEDGELKWQGQIIRRVEKDRWAAQLYSWDDGEPTRVVIVDRAQMDAFRWYASDDLMNEGWIQTLPPEDQNRTRRMSEAWRKLLGGGE